MTSLNGIGPKVAILLEKLLGRALIIDLLFHRPHSLINRQFMPSISAIRKASIVTLRVNIVEHHGAARAGRPSRVTVMDDAGDILDCVFFHARGDFLVTTLPLNSTRIISGLVERFQDRWQMVHPDYILKPDDDIKTIMGIEPVYPLTHSLHNKTIRRFVHMALSCMPVLPEWLDPAHKEKEKFPAWHDAVRMLHTPQSEQDIYPHAPPLQRLAYDELLANQLALALVRNSEIIAKGRSFPPDPQRRAAALAALPFQLTASQKAALADIDDDMQSPNRMLRLIQGDVGSGKTVVAFLAMVNAITRGAQAILMAPTEILARQHGETIAPLAQALNISCILLTGRDSGKPREAILEKIADGRAQLIIGTHAVFQDSVIFHNLGLAIIDEQHRFGVHQRLLLSAKGTGVDMLVMTATPIPRTLSLTLYGDMHVSRITEKPPGRKPIATRVLSADKMDDVIKGLRKQIEQGEQIYWVCPLVEESEKLDLAAAHERYLSLQLHFGDRVGLIHGKMKAAEKDAAMHNFSNGQTRLLVATTVIEVGVNVPNATIMVIEHAERFGLAQLHQLRGRVGRSDKESHCLLLYHGTLNETAKARLAIMRDTEDGFRIAEEDLRLRGMGDILGTKQSGLPEFRIADLTLHGDLLAAARMDAKLILSRDADLQSERGQALRVLLYLFERDAGIRLLRAG